MIVSHETDSLFASVKYDRIAGALGVGGVTRVGRA